MMRANQVLRAPHPFFSLKGRAVSQMEQSNFFAMRAFMFTFKTAFLLCRECFHGNTFFEREEVNKEGEKVWGSNFSPVGSECLDIRAPGNPFPAPTGTRVWGGCCVRGLLETISAAQRGGPERSTVTRQESLQRALASHAGE